MSEDNFKSKFVEYEKFEENLKKVKDGNDALNWIVVRHDLSNDGTMVCVGQGENGPDEMNHLFDSHSVFYALVKIMDVYDSIKLPKFAMIYYVGKEVPLFSVGKLFHTRDRVQSIFMPYHCLIETGNRADLTEHMISEKIAQMSGSRARSSSVHDGNVDGGEASVCRTRSTRVMRKDGKLTIDPMIAVNVENVRDPKGVSNWCLLTYSDINCRQKLVYYNSGDRMGNELSDLRNCLQQDKIFYGIYKTHLLIDNVKTEKFIKIVYLGEKVSVMAKAVINIHASIVDSVVRSTNATFFCSDLRELTEHNLENCIKV